MISNLTSVRLWSQQTALNAFKEASGDSRPDNLISNAAHRSLADELFGGNDGRDEDSSLSALIASLQRQAMTGIAPAAETDEGLRTICPAKPSCEAFRKNSRIYRLTLIPTLWRPRC